MQKRHLRDALRDHGEAERASPIVRIAAVPASIFVACKIEIGQRIAPDFSIDRQAGHHHDGQALDQRCNVDGGCAPRYPLPIDQHERVTIRQ